MPLRNIFDQYDQNENRLTHALCCALAEDDKLLRAFLLDFADRRVPARVDLEVEEQSIPGEVAPPGEEEEQRRGLPDAWIHANDEWAVLVESKVTAPVEVDQLRRHLNMARRQGAQDVTLLLVTARDYTRPLPAGVKAVSWRAIYAWLTKHRSSEWAARALRYFEVLEARMVEKEQGLDGTLTQFSGFPFSPERPYHYGEAKRVLRLAMSELRRDSQLIDILNIDPEQPGRTAITGRDHTRVWDFLPLKHARDAKNFTGYPHLTLSIEDEFVFAHVTVPNGLKTELRQRWRALSEDEFGELLAKITKRLDPTIERAPGAAPWFVGLQRRYPSQRSVPIVDARFEFDLRALVRDHESSVKTQPILLQTAYSAIQNRAPNFQVGVGLKLSYRYCPAASSPEALGLVADAWLACRPLIDLLVNPEK